ELMYAGMAELRLKTAPITYMMNRLAANDFSSGIRIILGLLKESVKEQQRNKKPEGLPRALKGVTAVRLAVSWRRAWATSTSRCERIIRSPGRFRSGPKTPCRLRPKACAF